MVPLLNKIWAGYTVLVSVGIIVLILVLAKSMNEGAAALERIKQLDAQIQTLSKVSSNLTQERVIIRERVVTNTIVLSNAVNAYDKKVSAYVGASNWLDAVRVYTNRNP